MNAIKYSDLVMDWLAELGYTHCFGLPGGHCMHIIESASRRFQYVPVVHEVAAGIATEYFNKVSPQGRAFALVTSGPGLTNLVTAIAGAYLENRELLVLGGQVKTADLKDASLRQRGIQELDGVSVVTPITVRAERLLHPLDRADFTALAEAGSGGRKGPVFIEMPLDIQGRQVNRDDYETAPAVLRNASAPPAPSNAEIDQLAQRLGRACRPAILIGSGVDRAAALALGEALAALGVPVQTTVNGSDRMDASHPLYFGRPNTWGMRYANLILQQADLVIALGTRLGLQQTGFNWPEFVPGGDVVQVDCEAAELAKGHPELAASLRCDATAVLRQLAALPPVDCADWLALCREIKAELPLSEACNQTGAGFISPYDFYLRLSELATADDLVVPCSSGGAFTVSIQTWQQKAGQSVLTDKSLASMGYGLSGAIGAAIAGQGRRTLLVEGDGGFAQNLQEVGTVAINRLNLKMFVFDDEGYASIRMTQRNYFGGRYVGCDRATGVGLPQWEALFAAYAVPVLRLAPGFETDPAFLAAFNAPGPAAFIVPVDPLQTYLPKINSRVTESGSMVSNPLHLMHPPLDEAQMQRLGRHLPAGGQP